MNDESFSALERRIVAAASKPTSELRARVLATIEARRAEEGAAHRTGRRVASLALAASLAVSLGVLGALTRAPRVEQSRVASAAQSSPSPVVGSIAGLLAETVVQDAAEARRLERLEELLAHARLEPLAPPIASADSPFPTSALR